MRSCVHAIVRARVCFRIEMERKVEDLPDKYALLQQENQRLKVCCLARVVTKVITSV